MFAVSVLLVVPCPLLMRFVLFLCVLCPVCFLCRCSCWLCVYVIASRSMMACNGVAVVPASGCVFDAVYLPAPVRLRRGLSPCEPLKPPQAFRAVPISSLIFSAVGKACLLPSGNTKKTHKKTGHTARLPCSHDSLFAFAFHPFPARLQNIPLQALTGCCCCCSDFLPRFFYRSYLNCIAFCIVFVIPCPSCT